MGVIDAANEFDDVQSNVTGETTPTLALLRLIAENAVTLATGTNDSNPPSGLIDYMTEQEIEDDTGSNSKITAVTGPTEPTLPSIFQEALDYIDFLQTETQAAATFPEYTEVIDTDLEPTPPTLDTTDPELYTLNSIQAPTYDVPVWDDDSAWSGGDVGSDATVGALVAPFTWSGTGYTSELDVTGANVLYDAVKTDLQASDFGVDQLDGGLVYDRAVSRDAAETARAVADATSLFAAGGFSAPTGAANAAVARLNSQGRDKAADTNRDVMIQKSALFLEAKKLAYSLGLQIETLEQGFYHADNDRLLKRLTQEVTSTVEVGSYNIARINMHTEKYAAFARVFGERVSAAKGVIDLYASEVSAEGQKASVNKTLVENFVSKNKNLIDTYVAQLEGFKTVLDARVRYHNVLADVFKSETSNRNAKIDGVQGAYDLADKQHKNLIDYQLGKYNGDVAHAKFELDEISTFLTHKIDQLKTQAQSSASVAAAAMSALNVNLGMNIGASTNVGGTESHAYDETKGTNPGETTSNVHTHDETKRTDPGTQTQEIEYSGGQTNTNYNYTGEAP